MAGRKLVLWLGALVACGGAGDPDGTKPKQKAAADQLELDWVMKVDGGRLRIDYTFNNHTAGRVVVVDQLTVGNALDADAIVVKNADALPGTVAFVRAFVPTNEKVLQTPFPGGRLVEPGASVKGTAFTALPPRAWHNFSTVPALDGSATQAVLEIGYIEDPVTFRDVQLSNAQLKVPIEIGKQKLLRGDPKPLPKP